MEVDPGKALDFLGTTVAVISVAEGDRRNVMSATRVTCVAPKPSLVAVSVAKRRYTHDLIQDAGEFVVNIASSKQADLAAKAGSG
ncbi:MAG: flavin reductase, partial [Chloroflexi bacterium]|nr:flavin reductase [Chloroflexota bacterium]